MAHIRFTVSVDVYVDLPDHLAPHADDRVELENFSLHGALEGAHATITDADGNEHQLEAYTLSGGEAVNEGVEG